MRTGIVMSALIGMWDSDLTFYLTFEEGKNAAMFKLIGETASYKEITNNLLSIHR
jgi:hypothetical protein